MRINTPINYTNKHKIKIYNHYAYTLIIIIFVYFFSLMYIRMNGNNINFDDKKIKKTKFYQNKKVFQINDIDVNKILVSKKEPYGKHNSLIYFIGYNDNYFIRPLCLRLPQMTGYAKKINDNVTMFFRVNNKQLLKNYNKIWEKTEKLMRIDLKASLFLVMVINI